MRNIKLAVLALTLICGAVGAYGKYKKAFQIYYVAPGYASGSPNYLTAANSPSLNCTAGTFGYVCTISAEADLPIGTNVPEQDATIITVYN